MKINRLLYFFAVIFCIFAFPSKASAAKIPFIYEYSTNNIHCIKELPQEFEMPSPSGNETVHYDLGIMYDQLNVLMIPIWNSDAYYCLYHKVSDDEIYYNEISEQDFQLFRSDFNDIPEDPSLPFWDRIGGKLLFSAIIAIFLGVCFLSAFNKDDDDDDDDD